MANAFQQPKTLIKCTKNQMRQGKIMFGSIVNGSLQPKEILYLLSKTQVFLKG